jgi:acyl-CoA dehydrogenase
VAPGCRWPSLYDIVALLGRHAVPVPLAASIAARALVAPGTPLRAAPLALATVLLRQPDGSLLLPRIPQAAAAHQVLAADGSPAAAAGRPRRAG